MKRLFLIILSLSFALIAGMAEAQPDTLWTRVFGGPANEQFQYADLLPNGNLRVFVNMTVRQDSTYLGLLTISPDGDSLATRVLSSDVYISDRIPIVGDSILQCRDNYNGVTLNWIGFDGGIGRSVALRGFEGSIESLSLAILSDNSIAIAVKFRSDEAVFVRVVSADGDSLWSSHIQSDYELRLFGLYKDNFWGVVVVTREGFSGDYDLRLTHLDRNGQVIFDQFYTQTSSIEGIWFQRGLYVSMLTRWEDRDWYRFVTLTREGDVNSVGEGIATDSLSSIGYVKQISDDSFIMTSQTDAGFGGNDSYFAKVNFGGDILWERALGGSGDEGSLRPVFAPDGSLYLAGVSSSFYRGRFENDDLWVVKVESEDNFADPDPLVPFSPLLLSAYPNPFNSSAIIEYHINRSGFVKLGVFDVAGRMVETLADGYSPIASRKIVWNGAKLPAGQYQILLTGPSGNRTTGITLVK